jgi:hypothetical protein
MTSWHSPGSLFNIGHKATEPLFDGRMVSVQEKVDGSFFAFGVFRGELRCRSKGQEILPSHPPAMFRLAVETAIRLQPSLVDGWTYRGEALCKPKHNSLTYDRVPNGNVILFDIARGEEDYHDHVTVEYEARRLGLDVVPEYYVGQVPDAGFLMQFLDRTSILGGQQVEGVVVKPITPLYGPDKKRLVGKLVSDRFREVHNKEWKRTNPQSGDFLRELGEQYTTHARWQKAVLHLKENGTLTETMRDIGPLIKEVNEDVQRECKDEISEKLFKWAWRKELGRAVTKGLPEWWKRELGFVVGEGNADPTDSSDDGLGAAA